MKVSVSLPEEDVEFLDSYARSRGITSRSAALTRAIRLLRVSELSKEYAAAWQAWEEDEGQAWEVTIADGIIP
jgi:Arc/MetJ-type ribon-helix-helix transcriptional regulator